VSRHLEAEELESLALGAQPGEPALMHLAECEGCARELAWARAERNLLARRPAPAVDHLWTEVARRIATSSEQGRSLERRRRAPHWAWRTAVAGAGVAATAAVLLIMLRPATEHAVTPIPIAQQQRHEAPPGPDAKTLAALDRAESDYRDAAKVLEEEYARLRPALDVKLAGRWDETLTRARTQLGEVQKSLVAQDVNARMRVLDGYAAYVRSLRNAVLQSQEANP